MGAAGLELPRATGGESALMRPRVYSLTGFRVARLIARLLPTAWSRRCGATIARCIYGRHRETQSALAENLRIVTGVSGRRLDALCRANVGRFGIMLADYFRCAAGRKFEGLVAHWEGLEHVERAQAEGRGVILVTAHLGHWELGGLLLAGRGFKVSVVTLEEPESALTQWRDERRRAAGLKTIAVGPGHSFSFVEIVQTLRTNEVVAMLVDRPYAGSGVPVRFFDRSAEFSAGPALLWQHTGAAIIPAFVFYNDDGSYTAVAERSLEFTCTADSHSDIARNTQLLASHFENVIRQHPDQWFNYGPIWPEDS